MFTIPVLLPPKIAHLLRRVWRYQRGNQKP